jgi:sterol desaturase/sphingolipid hydroxylase (fatty acid hydroxylase superfamily)
MDIEEQSRLRPLLEKLFVFALLFASYGTIMMQMTSRMFWPYMITSYLFAGLFFVLYEWRVENKRDLSSMREYLFTKDIWLHRSAVLDYALFLVNYYIFMTINAHFILSKANVDSLHSTSSGLVFTIMQALHIPHGNGEPGIAAVLIFTFCSFMLAELFFYIWHRLTHRVPILWEFHKVHHSAEIMTPLTYIRNHPFDIWMENLVRLLALFLASAVFLYLYPTNRGQIIVGGVDLFAFLTYLLGANLHHSHIWISFGRFERFFISPAQHQIHHSNDPKHYDRNFGSMIAFWDWIFGSLYMVRGRENVKFGLSGKDHEEYSTLKGLLLSPLKNTWKHLKG